MNNQFNEKQRTELRKMGFQCLANGAWFYEINQYETTISKLNGEYLLSVYDVMNHEYFLEDSDDMWTKFRVKLKTALDYRGV